MTEQEQQRVYLHCQWWKVWTDIRWVAIALNGPLVGYIVAGPADEDTLRYACTMQGWRIEDGD